MHTYCSKVISYFNDKYHGGLDATANPRFRELVFVQINAIKWIVLSRVRSVFVRGKNSQQGRYREI